MPSLTKLDRYSASLVGFLQAISASLYIILFAWLATSIPQPMPKVSPVLFLVFVLTAFVLSALVCGSLVLGYPAILALRGKIRRAVMVLIWSGLFFALILAVVLVKIVVLH